MSSSEATSDPQCWKAIEALSRTVEHLKEEIALLRCMDKPSHLPQGGHSPFTSPLRTAPHGNLNSAPAISSQLKELQSIKQIVLRLDCEHGDMAQITQSVRELQGKLRATMEQQSAMSNRMLEVNKNCSLSDARLAEMEEKVETSVVKIFESIPSELMNINNLSSLIDSRVQRGIQDAIISGQLTDGRKPDQTSKLIHNMSELRGTIGNIKITTEETKGQILKVERHFRIKKTKEIILTMRQIIAKKLKLLRKRLFFRWKAVNEIWKERLQEKRKQKCEPFIAQIKKALKIGAFKKWKSTVKWAGHCFPIVTLASIEKERMKSGPKLRLSRNHFLIDQVLRRWVDQSRFYREERVYLLGSKSDAMFGSIYPAQTYEQQQRSLAAFRRGMLKWKRFVAFDKYPEPCRRVIISKCGIDRFLPRPINNLPLDPITLSESVVDSAGISQPVLSGIDKLADLIDARERENASTNISLAGNNNNISQNDNQLINTSNTIEITGINIQDNGLNASTLMEKYSIERFETYEDVEEMAKSLIRVTEDLKSTFLRGDAEVTNLLLLKYLGFMSAIPTVGHQARDEIHEFVGRFNKFEKDNASYIENVLKTMTSQFDSNDKVVKRLRGDINSRMDLFEGETLKNFKIIRSSVDAIVNKSLSDMEIVTKEQAELVNTNGRLNRLYLLHGEMLNKHDGMQSVITDYGSRILKIETERTGELKVRERLDLCMNRFESVESRLRVISATTLPSISNSQSSLSKSIVLLQSALDSQRSSQLNFEHYIDSTLNSHMLRPVAVSAVVLVYEPFEKTVCEYLRLGKSLGAIVDSILMDRKDIMRALVDAALNLAHQICNEVDKESVYFLINGSNPLNGGNTYPNPPSVYERRINKVASFISDLSKSLDTRLEQITNDKIEANLKPPTISTMSIITNLPNSSTNASNSNDVNASLKANPHNHNHLNSKHVIEARKLFLVKLEKFVTLGIEKYSYCIRSPKSSLLTKMSIRRPEEMRGAVEISRCAMCDADLDSSLVKSGAYENSTYCTTTGTDLNLNNSHNTVHNIIIPSDSRSKVHLYKGLDSIAESKDGLITDDLSLTDRIQPVSDDRQEKATSDGSGLHEGDEELLLSSMVAPVLDSLAAVVCTPASLPEIAPLRQSMGTNLPASSSIDKICSEFAGRNNFASINSTISEERQVVDKVDRRPASAGKFSKSINSQNIAISSGMLTSKVGIIANNQTDAPIIGNCVGNERGNTEFSIYNVPPSEQMKSNKTAKMMSSKVLVDSLSANFIRDVSIPAGRNSNLNDLNTKNYPIVVRPLSAAGRLSSKK